jgi:dynein heavy chain, axonemal
MSASLQSVHARSTLGCAQDAINDAKAKAEDFNARERVFGFPPTEYPVLSMVEQDLEPFYK